MEAAASLIMIKLGGRWEEDRQQQEELTRRHAVGRMRSRLTAECCYDAEAPGRLPFLGGMLL